MNENNIFALHLTFVRFDGLLCAELQITVLISGVRNWFCSLNAQQISDRMSYTFGPMFPS